MAWRAGLMLFAFAVGMWLRVLSHVAPIRMVMVLGSLAILLGAATIDAIIERK